MNNTVASNESPLAKLNLRWQHPHAQGQTVSLSELCRPCPELLAALELQVAALERMSALAEATPGDAAIAPDRGVGNATKEEAAIDPYATLPPKSLGQPALPNEVPAGGPAVPGYDVLGCVDGRQGS
jgi:hypothetical protein